MTLALAVAMTIAVSAHPAGAQESRREYRRMNWDESLPEAVKACHGKRFSVVSYRRRYEFGAVPTLVSGKRGEAIRSAARSNKWLAGQLKAKKLTSDDSEWVARARNGNLAFYAE